MQISNEEATKLLNKFVTIRNKYKKAKHDLSLKKEFEHYQNLCIDKFKYMVHMKIYRYKKFSNYLDLEQDGIMALISALRTFRPRKGNFYAWAHQYISTKISREANKHSTIKIPLQKTKEFCPVKVANFPLMIDGTPNSCDQIENIQDKQEVIQALANLTPNQRKIILLTYGFGDIKEHSINKVAKQLKLPVTECILMRNEALQELKKHFSVEL